MKRRFIHFFLIGSFLAVIVLWLFINRSILKEFYDDVRWNNNRKELRGVGEMLLYENTPPDTISIGGHCFVPYNATVKSDTLIIYYLYIPGEDNASFEEVRNEISKSGYSPESTFQKRYKDAKSLKWVYRKKVLYIESFKWEDSTIYAASAPPDTVRKWVKRL